MKTQQFINQLAQAKHKSLAFYYNGKNLVPAHYHITEIKEVTTRSVDCGGKPHFDEHIEVQLWLAQQQEDGHRINNQDILKIVELVDAKLKLNKELPLFFEYSDALHNTARYQVASSNENDQHIIFELTIPSTICKPRLSDQTACCTGTECC